MDKDITEKELLNATKTLKNKKAFGEDSISNEMIKNSINHLTPALLKLFNNILMTECFPRQWSEGLILPIYKAGDPLDPSNYRGITISNCIGKLFTKILNIRLLEFLTTNKLINIFQIGFMPKNRTADHILVLKTIIDTFKKKRKTLYICFVDLKKAFDTVHRASLIYKLQEMKISTKFTNIISDMYSHLTAKIKMKNGITENFPIQIGTRQGCNLSPSLFNIYMNDLPNIFDTKCNPISLNNTSIPCLMYADDLVIFSEKQEGLFTCLKRLETYCKKWRLSINTQKTKIIIVNKKKNVTYNFQINNNTIEITNNHNYLGIIISSNGSFKPAIEELYQKASRAYFSLRQSFNFQENTQPKTLIKLFQSMIQPILLYNAEIWGAFIWPKNTRRAISHSFTNIKHKFETLHTKLCKNALGVHKKSSDIMVMAELGRYPLMSNIIKHIYTYWQHILHARDNLLHKTLEYLILSDRLGHVNYYSRIKALFFMLNQSHLIYQCDHKQIKTYSNTIKNAYNKLYNEHFFKTLEEKANRENSGGIYMSLTIM